MYLISVYRDNAANMFPIYAGAAVDISNADSFLAESADLIQTKIFNFLYFNLSFCRYIQLWEVIFLFLQDAQNKY